MVPVCGMRVVRSFFVRARLVVFRRLLVMTCRVFVMLRRFPMMIGRFFRHMSSLSLPVPSICNVGDNPVTTLRTRGKALFTTNDGVKPPASAVGI